MLVEWKDLKEGDEVIIPSNSNLKYLKILKLGKKSHKCSFQKNVTVPQTHSYSLSSGGTRSWVYNKPFTCQQDVSKHNNIFYLKDEQGYRDIWLVKRDA